MPTRKVSAWWLLRSAVLLGVLLVHSCEAQNWVAFQIKHIDYPRQSAPNLRRYCYERMRTRRMNVGRPFCKTRNTFINHRGSEVEEVCTTGRTSNGKDFRSKHRFKVINCDYRRGSPNLCHYKGTRKRAKITVKCEHGKPVHLYPVP